MSPPQQHWYYEWSFLKSDKNRSHNSFTLIHHGYWMQKWCYDITYGNLEMTYFAWKINGYFWCPSSYILAGVSRHIIKPTWMSFMSAYPTMTPPTRKSQQLQPCAAGWASQNARPMRHSDREIKTHQDLSRPLTRKHDRDNECTSCARNVSCTFQLTLDFAYARFFKLCFYHFLSI